MSEVRTFLDTLRREVEKVGGVTQRDEVHMVSTQAEVDAINAKPVPPNTRRIVILTHKCLIP